MNDTVSSSGPETPRHRHVWRWVVLAAAVLLAGAVAAAWVFLPRIAEGVVLRLADRAGLEGARLTVTSIGMHRAEINGFAIGLEGEAEGVSADTVELTYSPGTLLDGRVGTIRLSGVRIQGRYGADGLSLGPLDALLADTGGESMGGGLPFDDVVVEGGKARFTTPDGDIAVAFDGSFSVAGDAWDGALTFDGGGAGIDAAGEASVSRTEDVLAFRLALPQAQVSRVELGGTLSLSNVAYEGDVREDEITSSLSGDAGFAPHDNAELPFSRVRGSLDVTMSGSPLQGRWMVALPSCVPIAVEGLMLGGRAAEVSDAEVCPVTDQAFVALDTADEGIAYQGAFRLPGVEARVLQDGQVFMQGRLPESIWEVAATPGALPVAEGKLSGGAMSLPQTGGGMALSGLRGNVTLDVGGSGPALAMTLAGSTLRDLASPKRFSPVSAAGSLALDVLSADGTLTGRVTAALPAGSQLASAEFSYRFADGSGQARFDSETLSFKPGGLQPQAVVPVLAGVVTDVSGAVSVSGEVRFARSGITRSSAVLDMQAIGFQTLAARFGKVAGKVRFSSLVPVRTDGTQSITIGSVDPGGLALQDGKVSLAIGKDAIVIEDAVWPFAGGELRIVSDELRTDTDVMRATMTAEAIDLGKLLEIVDLDGLSGRGLLEGKVPVEISDSTVYVRGAVLEAAPGGVIQYQSEASDAAGQSAEGASIAFRALEDFRFRVLRLELDGPATGTLNLGIFLEGANPAVYDGYPIKLTVRTEGAFLDLIQRGTVGFRAIDVVKGKDAAEGVSVERVDGDAP